jgi:ribosomal protein S18 acetylase RimI-like enzyme
LIEERRGDLVLTDDVSRLDVPRIHAWLCGEAYWALDRSLEAVAESLRRSHVYGVWQEEQQIAVARVMTDGVAFAYICDVFVAADSRQQGIGSWLVDRIVADLGEERVEQVLLATRDAHALYERAGFHGLNRPERWLELNPTVDGSTMRSSR